MHDYSCYWRRAGPVHKGEGKRGLPRYTCRHLQQWKFRNLYGWLSSYFWLLCVYRESSTPVASDVAVRLMVYHIITSVFEHAR